MFQLQELHQLNEGLCVVRRSGGPVMVIFSIKGSSAFCRWLDGTKLEGAFFPLSDLVPSSADCQPGDAGTAQRTKRRQTA
jgi:uncharacterized protein YodC (DUF2158 family)